MVCGLEFDRSNPVVLDMTTWLRPIPSFEESISPCSITLLWKVDADMCTLNPRIDFLELGAHRLDKVLF